jgi:hypothetical protein
MECERCCLAWDGDDTRPPCAPVTFTRLREGLEAEAFRIEARQAALVAAGLRTFRYQPALARALELRRAMRIVDDARAAAAKKGARA